MAKAPAIPITGNPIRLTMFMKGPQRTISESHWLDPTAFQTLADGLKQAVTLATLRCNMLVTNWKMTEVRVSKENIQKDSSVDASVALIGNGGFVSDASADDCINVRIESGELYRKTLYLAPVCADSVRQEEYTVGAVKPFDKAVNAYLNELSGTPPFTSPQTKYGFLATKKPGTTFTGDRIQSIVGVANGMNPAVVTVTTFSPHTIPQGVRRVVRLTRIPDKLVGENINGLYEATATAANTLILNSWKGVGAFVMPSGGYVRDQEKFFTPYTKYTVETPIGNRKRGGRTFLPLGRSRNKGSQTS